jgi:hypothetical protein
MTKRFCDNCGLELASTEGRVLTIHRLVTAGPDASPFQAELCADCADGIRVNIGNPKMRHVSVKD